MRSTETKIKLALATGMMAVGAFLPRDAKAQGIDPTQEAISAQATQIAEKSEVVANALDTQDGAKTIFALGVIGVGVALVGGWMARSSGRSPRMSTGRKTSGETGATPTKTQTNTQMRRTPDWKPTYGEQERGSMKPAPVEHRQTNYGSEFYRLPERTQGELKRIVNGVPALEAGSKNSFVKNGQTIIDGVARDPKPRG